MIDVWSGVPCIKAFDGCGKPQLRLERRPQRVVSGKACNHTVAGRIKRRIIIINTSCLQNPDESIHQPTRSSLTHGSLVGWHHHCCAKRDESVNDVTKFVRQ